MYWGYLSSLLKASEKGQGDVLKANGCSQTLIRAALLSLCGVKFRELNPLTV